MTWSAIADDLEAGRLRVTGDNVLVRVEQDQGDTRRDSPIVTPDPWRGVNRDDKGRARRSVDRALLGRVVAVGPGHYPEVRTRPDRPLRPPHDEETSPMLFRRFVPTEVKVGELVALASQLSGDVWPLPSGEYRMVREAEVLAVIEESEDAA